MIRYEFFGVTDIVVGFVEIIKLFDVYLWCRVHQIDLFVQVKLGVPFTHKLKSNQLHHLFLRLF